MFSAGSDLTSGGDYSTDRGEEYGLRRRRRRKPLIAAVEGPALGGGFELVLACDLVVASRTACFGFPEVRRGPVPTCAGLFRGPRTLSVNLARELVLTGEPIDADRAYAAGLVNVVTAAGGCFTSGDRTGTAHVREFPGGRTGLVATIRDSATELDQRLPSTVTRKRFPGLGPGVERNLS